jgi:hypothetical protein
VGTVGLIAAFDTFAGGAFVTRELVAGFGLGRPDVD